MKHQNLFVSVVGIAAWVHSTWSFATVIGGEVPPLSSLTDLPRWLYWILPGAAAAAAVDVGLISLAAQFRSGRGGRAKLVTFAVLSFISYLGQALFSLSHGGRYLPSTGLSAMSVAVASIVWECLIWTLPAALPVTLILWAWSDMESAPHPTHTNGTQNGTIDAPFPAQLTDPSQAPVPALPAHVEIECPDCDWSGAYGSQRQANMALLAHARHCKHNSPILSADISQQVTA